MKDQGCSNIMNKTQYGERDRMLWAGVSHDSPNAGQMRSYKDFNPDREKKIGRHTIALCGICGPLKGNSDGWSWWFSEFKGQYHIVITFCAAKIYIFLIWWYFVSGNNRVNNVMLVIQLTMLLFFSIIFNSVFHTEK